MRVIGNILWAVVAGIWLAIGYLLTGIIFGILCTLLKLPLPAPNCLAGVLGIFGVFLGYYIIIYFKGS